MQNNAVVPIFTKQSDFGVLQGIREMSQPESKRYGGKIDLIQHCFASLEGDGLVYLIKQAWVLVRQ